MAGASAHCKPHAANPLLLYHAPRLLPRSLLLWLCLGLAGRAWGYECDGIKVAKAAPYCHRVLRAARAQRGMGVCAAMPGVEHSGVEQVGARG